MAVYSQQKRDLDAREWIRRWWFQHVASMEQPGRVRYPCCHRSCSSPTLSSPPSITIAWSLSSRVPADYDHIMWRNLPMMIIYTHNLVVLFSNLWGSWFGNHPQEDSTKIWLQIVREGKNFKLGFLLYFGDMLEPMTTSEIFSQKKSFVSFKPPFFFVSRIQKFSKRQNTWCGGNPLMSSCHNIPIFSGKNFWILTKILEFFGHISTLILVYCSSWTSCTRKKPMSNNFFKSLATFC